MPVAREKLIDAPEACPLCGAGLVSHTPERADDYEEWEYGCDLTLLRMESGELYAEEDCANATDRAIEKINAAGRSKLSEER